MTYALTRTAFGASASGSASVDATKLTVQALQRIQQEPALREQLSYLGDLFAQAGTLTYELAAGNVPLGQILTLGTTVLGQLGASAGEMMPGLLTELGTAVGGAVSGVGAMMPLFAAVLGVASSAAASYTQKSTEASILGCTSWYQHPVSSRSGSYGGMLPCDFLHASVGRVFEIVGGKDCHLEEYGGQKLLICGPQTVFKRVGPKGIPVQTREMLTLLFNAIKSACKAPKSDGGLTLWPVYLDLLYSQFRNGNMSWELANWMYDCEALPSWKPPIGTTSDTSAQRCKCRSIEKRAWYEFQNVLTDWGLTINPIYEMDKPKAAALRAKIKQVLDELRNPKPTLAQLVAKQFTVAPIPKKTTAPIVKAESGPSWELFAFAAVALALAGGGYWTYRRQKAGQKGSRR